MKKIKTVKELIRAYDSGELDRENDILLLDNDTTFIYKNDKCVFEIHPDDLMCEMLELLNIPSEGV